MNDKLKNAMIGLFVIGAFAIVVFMLLFLHPTVGDDSKHYRIRFADIDKVNVGTRVNYAGKAVGEVTSIKEIEDPKNPRQVINGFVYLYEVDILVDSSVEIYNSDEVSLRTSGLLGEKSVAITPRAPKPGILLREIVPDQIILANETGSVEETLKEFKELSDKFEEALDSVISTLNRIKTEQVVENISKAASHISNVAQALDEPEKIRSILNQAESALASMDKSFAKTARGEGTVGQLLQKDDLYLRLNSVLSKGETLMDDMNHYGLLFHTDKGWQRMRARRANLLAKLESPMEFRNYFNDEIDSIMTSLSRVNTVVEKSIALPYFCSPCEDAEFKKVFYELLRRVKMMEDSLELYNQGLMAEETARTELNPCCGY